MPEFQEVLTVPIDRAALLAQLAKAGYHPSLVPGVVRRILKRLAKLEHRKGRPATKRESAAAVRWDLRNAGTMQIHVRPAAKIMLVRRAREIARFEGRADMVDMVGLATEIILAVLGEKGRKAPARRLGIVRVAGGPGSGHATPDP